MSTDQAKITWIYYMLALLKKRLSMTWPDFDTVQKQYSVLDFLFKQYELLHYYDNDYIISDILKYIKSQCVKGGDFPELRRVI